MLDLLLTLLLNLVSPLEPNLDGGPRPPDPPR